MTPDRFRRLRAALDRRQPDLTVLLENVHKPQNFHAILRTCDAVGIATAHAVTPDGPLRSHSFVAAGSDRWVAVETHLEIGPAFAALRQQGLRVLAAHLAPEANDFRAEDYTRPTAILMGQEKYGVSEEALAAADGFVRIPMAGLVSSLNVSVATALILFEAQRQRAAAGLYDGPRLDPATYDKTLFEWAYPELADYCRRRGRPYPRLDEDGELLDPIA